MLTLVIEIKNVLTKVFINLKCLVFFLPFSLPSKLKNISQQDKQADVWMNRAADIYSHCVTDKEQRTGKKREVMGG